VLNDAFHARYLIYYYALFFTFLLFLQPLFLNGARSQLMLSQDPDIPDIVNDLRVIILPLGGSNLKEWAQSDFLRSLNIPEVHIYDRDFDTPPTYQSACDEVNNRNDNSWATLTSRKEIESYLHHDAINNEFNLTITESDIVSYNYDVPKLVVESILRATSHPLHSNLLRCKKDRDKKNLVKPYLNNQVVLGMTVEMLVQTDPNGDIRNWFEQIRLRLT
jgi:putative ATP-dependent endonuclease of OLD family